MEIALGLLKPLTVIATGLLAGALLAEARVLVPYWRKMPITEFLRLHHTMAGSLYGFYAPLTIAGTLTPILMSLAVLLATPSSGYWLLSGICAVGLLLFYLLFFKAANASFAANPEPEGARLTLERWAKLHNARTLVAIAGFVFAVIGLRGGG